jgi:hypothetical protein
MRYRPVQVAYMCLISITASLFSWPAVGQTISAPAGLISTGDRIALSIIMAVALLKLADLWISNLKVLREIKSDIASLQGAIEQGDPLEIGRSENGT